MEREEIEFTDREVARGIEQRQRNIRIIGASRDKKCNRKGMQRCNTGNFSRNERTLKSADQKGKQCSRKKLIKND